MDTDKKKDKSEKDERGDVDCGQAQKPWPVGKAYCPS